MKSQAEEKIAADPSGGQRAALFPALSEGSKEKRAVSILLACMEQVPELSRSLLQGQGAPLGKTSRLQAWTETGPVAKKGADRPDGRIEIQSARGQKWIALLEAKIGKAGLENTQIEAYLAEGRSVGAHALITISNDFAVLPGPSPDIPRQDHPRHHASSLVLELDSHAVPAADGRRRNRGPPPPLDHRTSRPLPWPPEYRRSPLRPHARELEGDLRIHCGRRARQKE